MVPVIREWYYGSMIHSFNVPMTQSSGFGGLSSKQNRQSPDLQRVPKWNHFYLIDLIILGFFKNFYNEHVLFYSQ